MKDMSRSLVLSVVLAAALLSGCSLQDQKVVSAEQIILNAAMMDKQHVRACGVLVDALESCALLSRYGRPFKDHPELTDIPPSMWISAPRDTCMPGNETPMNGPTKDAWAIVEGTFHTGGGFGHMSLAQHMIVATQIQLIQGPCDASEHGP